MNTTLKYGFYILVSFETCLSAFLFYVIPRLAPELELIVLDETLPFYLVGSNILLLFMPTVLFLIELSIGLIRNVDISKFRFFTHLLLFVFMLISLVCLFSKIPIIIRTAAL